SPRYKRERYLCWSHRRPASRGPVASAAGRWRDRYGACRRCDGNQVDENESMLLTIDVGNTNTVLGVFRGEELIAHWRLTTARLQTVDEYGVLTRNLFTLKELDPKEVRGVIISSVVPPMNWTLSELSKIYFEQRAMFVEPGVKTGMAVLVDNPLEV